MIKDYLAWQGYEVVKQQVWIEPIGTMDEQQGELGWLERFNTRSKKLE